MLQVNTEQKMWQLTWLTEKLTGSIKHSQRLRLVEGCLKAEQEACFTEQWLCLNSANKIKYKCNSFCTVKRKMVRFCSHSQCCVAKLAVWNFKQCETITHYTKHRSWAEVGTSVMERKIWTEWTDIVCVGVYVARCNSGKTDRSITSP